MIIWTWIQEELLEMQWLSHLVNTGLIAIGIPLNSPAGGAIQFFLYDVIKITLLLCVLIFTISYIQSYFPQREVVIS